MSRKLDKETEQQLRIAYNIIKKLLEEGSDIDEVVAAKTVTARKAPTIWFEPPYKVELHSDLQEGSHKKKHVHLKVSKGKEEGAIAIVDGEVLNGNLKQDSVKWCKKNVLTEENKKRMLKMLKENDFYRLDNEEKSEHKI